MSDRNIPTETVPRWTDRSDREWPVEVVPAWTYDKLAKEAEQLRKDKEINTINAATVLRLESQLDEERLKRQQAEYDRAALVEQLAEFVSLLREAAGHYGLSGSLLRDRIYSALPEEPSRTDKLRAALADTDIEVKAL